jgi:hypothetical protein
MVGELWLALVLWPEWCVPFFQDNDLRSAFVAWPMATGGTLDFSSDHFNSSNGDS